MEHNSAQRHDVEDRSVRDFYESSWFCKARSKGQVTTSEQHLYSSDSNFEVLIDQWKKAR